jgi:hypothetical protein
MGHIDSRTAPVPPVVGDALLPDPHDRLNHVPAKGEAGERPYRVAGQVDPGSGRLRGRGALHDLHCRASSGKRASHR